jgi:signal transduction histidine kinase
MAERLNVLVVEDDPGAADLVSERLGESSVAAFGIQAAATLDEALAAIAATPVDAVLVDLNLPDSRGLETLRLIRGAAATGTPVVVVSGSVDDDMRRHALAAGADEVFDKGDSSARLFARCVLYLVQRSRSREERRELENVLACTPDAILVVAVDGEVRYVNPAALSLFAVNEGAFVGERVGFSVKDGERSEVTITRGGDRRLCEIRVVPIAWRGERASLASLRDVTERKRLEAQLAESDRLVAIGTLAAGVAHEINNPLAVIFTNLELATRTLTELARGTPLPDDLLDELGDAQIAADRVRHVVRDLRLFARADDGERGPIDVHSVIDATLRLAHNEIRHRANLVKAYGHVPLVEANEGQLGQVILNLLVNAAQAIPEGRREVNEIRIATDVDEAGRVRISIADTGAGMPPDVQGRLFSAFFTTKPAGVGTGLGLAISRRIVTVLGGEITFSSELGVGTQFVVVLPPAGQGPPVRRRAPSARRPLPRRRGRVLLVEDDESVALTVMRLLGPHHDVVVTHASDEALTLLAEAGPFDVVLCDVMLPGSSGRAIYERARAVDAAMPRRFVFMTGGAFTPEARAFLDDIPCPRLDKPFDAEELLGVVAQLVD